jgi:CheY-like chemotaxis protein
MDRHLALANQVAGLRVLVIDDSANARDIIGAMATGFGMSLALASSGVAGLQAAEAANLLGHPFDVVLTDWKMPGMDGIEIVRRLLELSPRPPAIIMVTAYGRDNVLASAREGGVQLPTILTKPVTADGLLAAISQALGQSPRVEPAQGRRQNRSAESRSKLAGARLLLVEDNALNQELAFEILVQAGIEVVLAADGQQALDRLTNEGPFDGVLMDCEMPVMDGYEATARIRANPDWAKLPVLAMTANAMVGDRERVIAVGMNDHIAKPLDIDEMFNVIGQWVSPAVGRRPAAAPPAPPEAPAELLSPDKWPELSELPGIDTAAGRARALGRPELYLRLLRIFLQNGQQFETQFRDALAAGYTNMAQRLAHTLKGSAANIEAAAIRHAAGLLEQACQTDPAAVDRLLTATLQTLEPVLAGLVAALAAIDTRSSGALVTSEGTLAMGPTATDSRLPRLLRKLMVELEAGEGEALQTLAGIRTLLAGSPLAARLEPMTAAIGGFDFEPAAQLVGALFQELTSQT